MSRTLPPSSLSRHKPDVYPHAKGVAPPTSTLALRAMFKLSPAWLLAACLGCLALLSFLVASTFGGKSADADPSASVAALTPAPVVDSSIPLSPPSPAVEAKVAPVLTTAKTTLPTAAVKNKAGDIVLAAAKNAPETRAAIPAPDPFVARSPDPKIIAAVDALALPEKAPIPDRAVLEKPPVAPPAALAKKMGPDPRIVDCNKLGTRIVFLRDPPEAFKTAGKERKLVFFLHLSGNFEDDAFT